MRSDDPRIHLVRLYRPHFFECNLMPPVVSVIKQVFKLVLGLQAQATNLGDCRILPGLRMGMYVFRSTAKSAPALGAWICCEVKGIEMFVESVKGVEDGVVQIFQCLVAGNGDPPPDPFGILQRHLENEDLIIHRCLFSIL